MTSYFTLDFEFFGLQNGDECHCDNNAWNLIPARPLSCDERCLGDKLEFCIGSWRMKIYPNYSKKIESTVTKDTIYSTTKLLAQLTNLTSFKPKTELTIQIIANGSLTIKATFASVSVKTTQTYTTTSEQTATDTITTTTTKSQTNENKEETTTTMTFPSANSTASELATEKTHTKLTDVTTTSVTTFVKDSTIASEATQTLMAFDVTETTSSTTYRSDTIPTCTMPTTSEVETDKTTVSTTTKSDMEETKSIPLNGVQNSTRSQRYLLGNNFISFSESMPFLRQLIDENIVKMKSGPKMLLENKIFDIHDHVDCKSHELLWTEWQSVDNKDGNDFELFSEHQQYHRVCDFPSHIEAREIDSKIDWIRSKFKLIHDISTNNENSKWSFGLSKNYG